MTHTIILSGTEGGHKTARFLSTEIFQNENTIVLKSLESVDTGEITTDFVVNTSSFTDVELELIDVSSLDQVLFENVNTFEAIELEPVVFAPDNAETSALVAQFDQSYSATIKNQMDALISELKSAGVWAKLDWYGNGFWARSEHDALINWVNPTQKLKKVGNPYWVQGFGLVGDNTNPVINSRYKSGWNIGDGPNSSPTDFAFFCSITSISVPQNGLQPMGVWRNSSHSPDGSFFKLSIFANSGSSGANVLPSNGNSGFVVGDGLGVWGVSRNGGTNITVKDGVTLDTDSVSGASSYTHIDGMSVVGSAGAARRSFPGTQLYWGWGASLSAAEFGALETSFQTSLST